MTFHQHHRAVIVFCAIMIGCDASAARPPDSQPATSQELISISAIRAETRQAGLSKALSTLQSNDAKWRYFRDQVGAGHHEWVDLAIEFRPALDGGAAFDLSIALSLALTQSPSYVLGRLEVHYTGKDWLVQDICGQVDHGDRRLAEQQEQIKVLQRQRDSVMTASSPHLRQKREACTKQIDGIIGELRRNP